MQIRNHLWKLVPIYLFLTFFSSNQVFSADLSDSTAKKTDSTVIKKNAIELKNPNKFNKAGIKLDSTKKDNQILQEDDDGNDDEENDSLATDSSVISPVLENSKDVEKRRDSNAIQSVSSYKSTTNATLQEIQKKISNEYQNEIADDNSDESEDDNSDETHWNLSANAQFYSKYLNLGIDIGNEHSAFLPEFNFNHTSGIFLKGNLLRLNNTSGAFQGWMLGSGYEYEFNKYLSVAMGYNYYKYQLETTASLFSSLSNSLSAESTLKFDSLTIGLSYEYLFGKDAANFLGLDIGVSSKIWKILVQPHVSVYYSWQSLTAETATKIKRKKVVVAKNSKVQLSGVSSYEISTQMILPLGKYFSLTLTPIFVYSPNSEVSVQSSTYYWYGGIQYIFDF